MTADTGRAAETGPSADGAEDGGEKKRGRHDSNHADSGGLNPNRWPGVTRGYGPITKLCEWEEEL